MNKLFLGLLGFILSGCTPVKPHLSLLSTYYIQKNGVQMAIPVEYLDADGLTSRKYQAEIQAKASSPPGYEASILYLMLDPVTFKGLTYREINARKGVVDNLILTSDKGLSFSKNTFIELNRRPELDYHELKAYKDPSDARVFYKEAIDGQVIIAEIQGVGMSNPSFNVAFIWNGIYFNYYYNSFRRDGFKGIHRNILKTLNGFKI